MKLGTLALAATTLLGASAIPADAGSMSKKGHAQQRRVYIDPNVSTKNLRALQRQLQNNQHRAVRGRIDAEIYDRQIQNLNALGGLIQLGIGGASRGPKAPRGGSGGGHR